MKDCSKNFLFAADSPVGLDLGTDSSLASRLLEISH